MTESLLGFPRERDRDLLHVRVVDAREQVGQAFPARPEREIAREQEYGCAGLVGGGRAALVVAALFSADGKMSRLGSALSEGMANNDDWRVTVHVGVPAHCVIQRGAGIESVIGCVVEPAPELIHVSGHALHRIPLAGRVEVEAQVLSGKNVRVAEEANVVDSDGRGGELIGGDVQTEPFVVPQGEATRGAGDCRQVEGDVDAEVVAVAFERLVDGDLRVGPGDGAQSGASGLLPGR